MKKNYYFFVCLLIFPFFLNTATAQPEITPALQNIVSEKGDDEFISVNIRLSKQYDEEKLFVQSRQISGREARREFVVNELKDFRDTHQAGLLSYLEARKSAGKVKEIRSFWISNVVNCLVKPEVVNELAAMKDLARLDYNKERYVLMSDAHQQGNTLMEPDNTLTNNLAWNVTLVNADQAWNEGFTGEGIVVAVLDTGVNYNHQDLQGNMWTHPDYPNHGYNTAGNNHNTMDYNSHGTHCAGTVAGHGAAGTGTGIAPGASIMALKVLSDSGSSSEAAVWAGIQFAVDYGAHIMSLSLGWMHSWGPDRSTWRSTMNNALSAGLIASVASGNEGSSGSQPPSQVRTPGDIPPPWLHPDQTLQGGISAVVSVGATTSNDNLAGFSSKGPVSWQDVSPFNDYAYAPGMGLIRPDVVAPGSGILSLTHNSNAGYTTKSGTSMAAPAVAGAMALILSKNPNLLPEQVSQILEETAFSTSGSKNNTFGSGRIDALEAVLATPYSGVVYQEHELDDSQGNGNGKINPGEEIKFSMTFRNMVEETIDNVKATLSTDSPYITLNDTIAELGNFEGEQEKVFEEIFSFEVSDTIPAREEVRFVLEIFSEDEPGDKWRSSFTELAYAPELTIAGVSIDDSEYGNNNGQLDPGETAALLFEIKNTGLSVSEEIHFAFDALHPFIQNLDPETTYPPLEVDESFFAEFTITVHEGINPGTNADFFIFMENGAFADEMSLTKKIGNVIEDFASGEFDGYDWEFSGHADWYIDQSEAYEGSYSARSGDIDHSQRSELILEYEVLYDDSISFYRKVSSENHYDWLEFYIDNQRVGRWSGERDWAKVKFPVEAGTRTFRWVYEKDYVISEGQDCGWIDKIEFPVKATTTAIAGFDAEMCGAGIFETRAYAAHYNSLEWTSGGDGVFTEPSQLSTFYIPGDQDRANGSVELTLEVQYHNEDPVQDEMVLTILPSPYVDFGQEEFLCYGETLLLDAGEGDFTYEWFDGSQEQTYLVDPDNFEETEVQIWVTVMHENGCMDTDTVNVVFQDCTGIHETDLAGKLEVFPNPASEKVTVSFFNPTHSPATISLIAHSGQTVKAISTGNQEGWKSKEMNISGLNSGIYFLRIHNRQFTITRKLLIQ